MRQSNERSYVGRAALFEATKADVYDAYEKDIAVAHFFFRTPTVFQFTREVGKVARNGFFLGCVIH